MLLRVDQTSSRLRQASATVADDGRCGATRIAFAQWQGSATEAAFGHEAANQPVSPAASRTMIDCTFTVNGMIAAQRRINGSVRYACSQHGWSPRILYLDYLFACSTVGESFRFVDDLL
jgi:hypothetical protein